MEPLEAVPEPAARESVKRDWWIPVFEQDLEAVLPGIGRARLVMPVLEPPARCLAVTSAVFAGFIYNTGGDDCRVPIPGHERRKTERGSEMNIVWVHSLVDVYTCLTEFVQN